MHFCLAGCLFSQQPILADYFGLLYFLPVLFCCCCCCCRCWFFSVCFLFPFFLVLFTLKICLAVFALFAVFYHHHHHQKPFLTPNNWTLPSTVAGTVCLPVCPANVVVVVVVVVVSRLTDWLAGKQTLKQTETAFTTCRRWKMWDPVLELVKVKGRTRKRFI